MMISVERLMQYTSLPQEPPLSLTHDPLAFGKKKKCCGSSNVVALNRKAEMSAGEKKFSGEDSIVFDKLQIRYVVIYESKTKKNEKKRSCVCCE